MQDSNTTITKESNGGLIKSATYLLEQTQFIPKSRSEVFLFFSDAHNLERLTPPFLNFRILTKPPIKMTSGTLIDYRIKLYGVPLKWRTEIESFEPEHFFVDNQLSGPYAIWHHQHHFDDANGGTLMRDLVRYRLRFGLLGTIAHSLFVRRSLLRIFQFRRTEVTRIFS